MTILIEECPLGGLDLRHGALRLREVQLERVTWIAPYPGEESACGHGLQAAFSLTFPRPGEALENETARILWTGRAQALLIGPAPPAELTGHAAMVDQTEGWACLSLEGRGAADVLARLTPLELRPSIFGQGRTARSLLGHMTAQVTPVEDGFEILVMRSMAATAAHEIEEAIRSVSARSSLPVS